MNASQIRALANIADKPDASVSAQLIATRRICRLFCHERATIHQERRALRRKAAKLKAFLPFTAAAVADLEQQASDHLAESLEGMNRALIGIGRAVILQSASTTAALGFDRLCDLLSVNPAHRAQAIRDGDTNIAALVFIACLEDSATERGLVWGDGWPLYQACLLAMADFIRNAPEDALPDPFAPGAPFGPKLPPVLRVV
ncbi:hypothetical protein [Stutzerimonas kunmingensis]|uniref:hypothetical protein n=1 Tax=Stutzerimonas kunmingensis TaxID=1211807 RepID=UPI001F2809A2|nr:hypothetical protein [Stutzerimonas kunmingensis]UIP33029.1 hypothetical protein LW136_00725 [Stutzerimonas kunmingensis]